MMKITSAPNNQKPVTIEQPEAPRPAAIVIPKASAQADGYESGESSPNDWPLTAQIACRNFWNGAPNHPKAPGKPVSI